MNKSDKPGCGRVIVAILVSGCAIFVLLTVGKGERAGKPEKQAEESYRLIHAIGNTEKVSADGLSKRDCEARKKELKAAAERIGTHNERTGYGSITCIIESQIAD